MRKNTFEKKNTRDEEFTQADGEKIKVPFMTGEIPSRIGGFTSKGEPDSLTEKGFLDQDGFSMFELPYAGDELAMVFLLPHKVDGLPALERSLRIEQIPHWRRRLASGRYRILLPKMKLETQYDLRGSMRALGMVDVFDAGKADLGGIAESNSERLYVSAAVHKAFVEVNEEGTEAAAATGISISVTSAKPPPTLSFRADHPFIFMIIHKPTGAILFMGRYGGR